jgi:hypothetical protein
MARHAAVDLAQVFVTSGPRGAAADRRLPPAERARLREVLLAVGVLPRADAGGGLERRLDELRALYEPYMEGLADHLLLALPPWAPEPGRLDDWQTTADGMTAPSIAALLAYRGTATEPS